MCKYAIVFTRFLSHLGLDSLAHIATRCRRSSQPLCPSEPYESEALAVLMGQHTITLSLSLSLSSIGHLVNFVIIVSAL